MAGQNPMFIHVFWVELATLKLQIKPYSKSGLALTGSSAGVGAGLVGHLAQKRPWIAELMYTSVRSPSFIVAINIIYLMGIIFNFTHVFTRVVARCLGILEDTTLCNSQTIVVRAMCLVEFHE